MIPQVLLDLGPMLGLIGNCHCQAGLLAGQWQGAMLWIRTRGRPALCLKLKPQNHRQLGLGKP